VLADLLLGDVFTNGVIAPLTYLGRQQQVGVQYTHFKAGLFGTSLEQMKAQGGSLQRGERRVDQERVTLMR
jgi:hypothetical protein